MQVGSEKPYLHIDRHGKFGYTFFKIFYAGHHRRRKVMRSFLSVTAVSSFIISSILAALLFGNIDKAKAEPDSVPANALPVYCETAAGIGFESQFTCSRSDTDAGVLPVPAGQYLIVTDIHITRNNTATTGIFAVIIGVDDPGPFPSSPRLDITGTPIGVHQMNFTAPHIVLEEGETLAVYNFPSSNFPIDAYVSGFLVDDVTFQAFFQAYLPLSTR